MPPKFRADQLAFDQGLCESREKAKSLIMAGRMTYLLPDGKSQPVAKPGQQLSQDTPISILPGKTFVSRGAYKLQTLLDGFKLNVEGWVCLDAGASTGGFTDCLLQRKAAKIYAVDVGENQLHEKLKNNPAVINLEKINLRNAPADLIPEPLDFLTGDLSFISLTLILPACVGWLRPGGLMGILIKPQFELSPQEVSKGVVKSLDLQKKAVAKIEQFCVGQLGFKHIGTLPAAIKGPKGNQEYLGLFQKP